MRAGMTSEDDLQNYSWVVTSWQQQQHRPLQHRSTMILILAVYMAAWLFSFAISDKVRFRQLSIFEDEPP
ncbi:hypothetical protein IV203_006971 [Nitzschia inconspicua]|uniref:Transmembrane protein n=1 Tax=Nitzschia inconspicua TaxID=303405 RepID=A0A9K3PE76_9STRA|nr:hypothetical protein IV203_006971 [Nitzschia inconspicua]